VKFNRNSAHRRRMTETRLKSGLEEKRIMNIVRAKTF
jgi:hypothetical protein